LSRLEIAARELCIIHAVTSISVPVVFIRMR
jgi:hypothetical protein